MYNQIHGEQIAAGETTENIAGIPVVQEQVIDQAIPEVVDSLPPLKEFAGPVCNQIHQEQIAAVETTENIAEIPVGEEQVIVQEIPEVVGPLPPVCESTEPEYNQSPSGAARCQSPEHCSRKNRWKSIAASWCSTVRKTDCGYLRSVRLLLRATLRNCDVPFRPGRLGCRNA